MHHGVWYLGCWKEEHLIDRPTINNASVSLSSCINSLIHSSSLQTQGLIVHASDHRTGLGHMQIQVLIFEFHKSLLKLT